MSSSIQEPPPTLLEIPIPPSAEAKTSTSPTRLIITLNLPTPTPFVLLFHAKTPYCIESICPHSGGPLYKGIVEVKDMEDLVSDDQPFILCPWHSFKFCLKTGQSEDVEDEGHFAKVIPVTLKTPEIAVLHVPHSLSKSPTIQSIEPYVFESSTARKRVDKVVEKLESMKVSLDEEKKVEVADESKLTLTEWCGRVLLAAAVGTIIPPEEPPRHEGVTMVAPGQTKRRGKGGSVESRIAILHSLANIEQWAIDLAFDIIARFSGTVVKTPAGDVPLPDEFFTDFLKVATDEARHFTYLVERLDAHNCKYGDLPIHGALWESAKISSGSLLERLAIVHMVHEARGLDVNPVTISRFEKAKDQESTEYLNTIHNDEVTHVATGQKWFAWMCEKEGREKYSTFHEIVKRLFHGPLKPPFNDEDRLRAGLDPDYYLPVSAPPPKKA
ncbi:hypothetical protein HDU97_006318 [Phlyctochytrium planicorne]|nr:hypothetical protein HDU97_006318 [Phlyctochytrium planicorne]